jgi:hypothetical protein
MTTLTLENMHGTPLLDPSKVDRHKRQGRSASKSR